MTRHAPSSLRLRIAGLCAGCILSIATPDARQPTAVDRGFADFWKAEDVRGAERAAERLLRIGVSFDDAYARLAAGRVYAREKTGSFSMRFAGGTGLVLENFVEVPPEYTPEKAWQVRVQLHGGVNRRESLTVDGGALEEDGPPGGGRAPNLARRQQANRIPGESQIYIFPGGSREAAWWHEHQVDNILRLVDRVKRRYHVDESRIYLTGISDGGTGTYYMAMRDPTGWSAFLPLNGSIKVLSNPGIGVDGELYASNLANRPFYIVSGGRDPLYPAEHVATHVEAFKRLGVPLVFRPQRDAGHDTSWWPYERTLFEQYVKQKPRVAHPARVSWQTERTDRFNRADWLVITGLGAGAGDAQFPDDDLFAHRRASGRVDIERRGNEFVATSNGVRQFVLLLSPDAIDFTAPVIVTVNGVRRFEGVVQKNVAALLKWAARDAEKTRLYAAELTVTVP